MRKGSLGLSVLFFAIGLFSSTVFAETYGSQQKLISAIEVGDLGLIETVINEENFKTLDFIVKDSTPLTLAAGSCREDIAKLLVSRGASITYGIPKYYSNAEILPFGLAVNRGCNEKFIRSLYDPSMVKKYFVLTSNYKDKAFSLADLLVEVGGPKTISVEFLSQLANVVDFSRTQGLMASYKAKALEHFKFFLSVGAKPDAHLLYTVMNAFPSSEAETMLQLILDSHTVDPKTPAYCSLNLSYDTYGNAAECFFRHNQYRSAEWFFNLFNQKFDVQFLGRNTLEQNGNWDCKPEAFARYQIMLNSPQITLKDPQGVFAMLTIRYHNGLSQCESKFPYLQTLIDKYKAQLNLNDVKVTDREGKTSVVHPAGYILDRIGPNIYTQILIKAGADGSAAFWGAINDIEGARWLLKQGAKFPDDYLSKLLSNNQIKINLDYLKFLAANGFSTDTPDQAADLMNRAIDGENWREFFLASFKNSPGFKGIEVVWFLDRIYSQSEFYTDDKLHMELGNLLLSMGATAKESPLSFYCDSLPRMKWLKKVGGVDDKVSIKCLGGQAINYFAMLDAGFGKANDVLECESPISSLMTKQNRHSDFENLWNGLIKRGADLNATLCGRKILDRFIENLNFVGPSVFDYLASNKSWKLDGFQFKPIAAKMATMGASEQLVIEAIKRGASTTERYDNKNSDYYDRADVMPAGFIYLFGWRNLADLLIAKKTPVEEIPFTYRGRSYDSLFKAFVSSNKSELYNDLFVKFAKAGLLTKYNYGPGYRPNTFNNSLLLDFKVFPDFLVKVLPPKVEELRQGIGSSGKTILMNFVGRGEEQAVKTLITLGSDVNQQDDYQRTSLDIALEQNEVEIAKYLISVGGKRGKEKP